MRKQFSKLALTAILMLAITFTFSCTSPDDDKGGNNNGNGNGGSNTPSAGPCPNAVTGNGTLSCGGQTYKTVLIGDQVWMAKNLNYNVSGSKCYGNDESYCNKFGRLYDWETARVVCPSGWHLPSESDWGELISYVESNSGCSKCAGNHLKATSDWSNNNKSTDYYGFSALPGGGCGSYICSDVGNYGFWWSATEYNSDKAYYRDMFYAHENVYVVYNYKRLLRSVRCLQD